MGNIKKVKGSKRKWCRKKLSAVFCYLKRKPAGRMFVYTQVLLAIIPNSSVLAHVPIVLVGDPGNQMVVQATEKACTMFCKLAVVANKFLHTREGQSSLVWAGLSTMVYIIKSSNVLYTPAFAHSAFILALFCSGSYAITTLADLDYIGKSDMVETLNKWCFNTYGTLVGVSSLPHVPKFSDIIPVEKLAELIKALKSLK